MTWTKLGDELGDEIAELSDGAVRTYIDALMWSNRRLLDLVVPKKDLRRFAFSSAVDVTDPDGCDVIRELIAAGWWADQGDSWVVDLRHPDWQLTRVQVEAARERETKKKQRQRERAKQAREGAEVSASAPRSSRDPVPSRVPLGSPRRVSPGGVPGGTNAGRGCRVRGHEHASRRADGLCSACAYEDLGPEAVSA